jgi:hypothetical protein
MNERPAMMTVSDAAAKQVQALLDGRGKPSTGIRIGVRTKGCSGMSYTLEFADEQGPFDEILEDKGVTSWNPVLCFQTLMKKVAVVVANPSTFKNRRDVTKIGTVS